MSCEVGINSVCSETFGGIRTHSLTTLGIANLVLQDTVERIYSGNLYAEEHVGLYLVRGENVLLLGEIVSLPHFQPCIGVLC